jgi:hypothetical protein
MHRTNEPDAPRDANVVAMMLCETARMNFEEEMRSVLLVAGLFFLGILALNAIADEPIASFADVIAGLI